MTGQYSGHVTCIDQSQAAWSSAAASAASASEELFVWRAAQLGVFDRHLKFEFLTENQKSDPRALKTNSKVTFGELEQTLLQ